MNREAPMRLVMRSRLTRQPCSIVNSCIMAAGSIFISLWLAFLVDLILVSTAGRRGAFEVVRREFAPPREDTF
jgi:hypothetical protein